MGTVTIYIGLFGIAAAGALVGIIVGYRFGYHAGRAALAQGSGK